MKSKYCFDLHLFYNQGGWILLHVFTSHLYLFLWEFCLINVPISSLGCWFFRSWIFWVPYTFWILVPYCIKSWQSFFSHSVGYLLSLLTVSFTVQKLFSFMQSHLFILSLRCRAFWDLFKKSFPLPICNWAPLLKISSL
jgi:hypothetical protein